MEIPKDGRTYLMWHKVEGAKLVYNQGYHFYEIGNPVGWDPREFVRFMDERGQWHEINSSPQPLQEP
jgi:hypothetical protein